MVFVANVCTFQSFNFQIFCVESVFKTICTHIPPPEPPQTQTIVLMFPPSHVNLAEFVVLKDLRIVQVVFSQAVETEDTKIIAHTMQKMIFDCSGWRKLSEQTPPSAEIQTYPYDEPYPGPVFHFVWPATG